MSTATLPHMIYAEMTPNPATMKFVSNHPLIDNGSVVEFHDAATASEAPLVQRLFTFPFVKSVFIASNFITITKVEAVEWDEVVMELREYITNYLNTGHPIFSNPIQGTEITPATQQDASPSFDPQTPVEEKIVDILEEYVRPAVEGDGGAIHFKKFDEGVLTVVLKGACSGCPSSTVTLKAGIQSLFDRMLPEVKEVVAEEE